MPASRRLLVSQYHVLMLRHRQTLYLSQRLHSLLLTMRHQPKHLLVNNQTRRKHGVKKKEKKQEKADKKLKQIIRDTLPNPRRNKSARTPDPKQRGKEKSLSNTDRQPKGSDDPIR